MMSMNNVTASPYDHDDHGIYAYGIDARCINGTFNMEI